MLSDFFCVERKKKLVGFCVALTHTRNTYSGTTKSNNIQKTKTSYFKQQSQQSTVEMKKKTPNVHGNKKKITKTQDPKWSEE